MKNRHNELMARLRSTQRQPPQKNFHQIMVELCDTFQLTHPQMVALRQRIETIYHGQPKPKRGQPIIPWVSLEALARISGSWLRGGSTLEAILALTDEQFVEGAKGLEEQK